MAHNLPTFFVSDVRWEIADHTTYTDREIQTFARKAVNRIAPLIQSDTTAIDGPATWDFTVSGAMDNEYWEVIKWATVVYMLQHYRNKIIGQGIGVAVGLGSERIDTKSVLLTVKDMAKDAKKTLNEKILAYNLTHKQGISIDLYMRTLTW